MVATSAEARSQIVALVRDFVRREVEPVAAELDREDRVPHDLIDQMKELGLFGITVPEEYGGLGLDYTTFASIFEELSMGLMSLSGAIGTHHILTYTLTHYGTEEQKQRFLPDLASGKKRGGLALTEPGGGTDVANLQTTATKDGEEYIINGSKMFITNGRYGDMFCLLARTDRDMEPRHRGLSAFVMERGEPGSGFEVGRDLDKLGYRGLDTVELNFNNYAIPADNLIGEQEGVGFGHVMSGWRPGASTWRPGPWAWRRQPSTPPSATPSSASPSASPSPSTRPSSSSWRTWRRKIQAARLLVYDAAAKKDEGGRIDLESGMAKLFASEVCGEVTMEAMRIHGGYGFIKESPVERYYRDAPLMIIGEGTNEVMRLVIARQLLRRPEYQI